MSKLKPVHCYLIIIGAGIVLFFNTLQNQFVFDDESVVQGNESIQSLSSIPKYFTADEGSVASPVRPAIEPANSSKVKAVLIANRVFSNRPNRQLLGEET